MVVPTKMLLGAMLGALLGFAVGCMGTATGGKKETGARGAEEVRAGCTDAGMLLLLARFVGGAAAAAGAVAAGTAGVVAAGTAGAVAAGAAGALTPCATAYLRLRGCHSPPARPFSQALGSAVPCHKRWLRLPSCSRLLRSCRPRHAPDQQRS